MTLGEESYTRHKNRVKRARTLVEIAFVIAALYLLYTLFFHGKTYQPYSESQVSPPRPIRASSRFRTSASTASETPRH